MNFTIDEKYLVSVNVRDEHSMYRGQKSLTEEQMIKVLKGEDRWIMHSSIDHPEFTKLREELCRLEYIFIQRGWWNGDEVLKPFMLNGRRFKKGERFPCASATGITLQFKKR